MRIKLLTENIRTILYSGKITFLLLVGTAFCIPLEKKILPFFISLSFLFFLIQRKPKITLSKVLNNKIFVLLLSTYSLYIISLLYTKDIESGLFDLQVKLSLLIFPLIVFFSNYDFGIKEKKQIFKAFIFGNFLASLICLVIAFNSSVQNGGDDFFNASIWLESRDWPFWKLILAGYSFFNYSLLSYFHNPDYFAFYLLFALYLVYYLFIQDFKILSRRLRFFYIVSFVLFGFMVLLLQARAAILCGLAIIMFEFFRTFVIHKTKRIFKLVLSTIGIGIVSIFIIFSGRFNFIDSKADLSYESLKTTNIRIELWNSAIPIIKDNFLFGVGVGDVRSELIESYIEKNLTEVTIKYLNAHNQYIETFLATGLFGFALIILISVLPFFSLKNYRTEPIRLIFAIIVIFSFTFESTLNTLAGVLFFSYFYSLLNLKQTNNDTFLTTKN